MAELVTAPAALIGAVMTELTQELKKRADTRIKIVDTIGFIEGIVWWRWIAEKRINVKKNFEAG